ncbi:class I SAM-dependent methyltransferase [Streptomyces viridosporus]|uniref:class I SAM-dependent methyltransferase n=1 Tax=Streptomyces viridosporus TaxID=67581 RepID=UPI0033174CE2
MTAGPTADTVRSAREVVPAALQEGRGEHPTTDLWRHFGRARNATDRTVPGAFRWNWGQDGEPGAELLGDLTGLRVGDLGAGSGRHAAHLAVHHQPARVVDASPAQHAMGEDLYGHLAPGCVWSTATCPGTVRHGGRLRRPLQRLRSRRLAVERGAGLADLGRARRVSRQGARHRWSVLKHRTRPGIPRQRPDTHYLDGMH